jgi:hypothetical protein
MDIARFDKEVDMRLRSTIRFLVLGCFVVHLAKAAPASGNERQLVNEFRALTSEQSESRATTDDARPAAPSTTSSATMSQAAASAPVLVAPETNSVSPAAAPTIQPRLAKPQAENGADSAAVAPRRNVPTPVYIQPPPQAKSFYAGASARATLSQFPRRAPIQPIGQRQIRRQAKPFQGTEPEPTLSPYLNLDRDEDDSQNAPSFLTIVRPQLQQMEANQAQQREIQQLRNQVQSMSSGYAAPSQYDPGRGDGMNTSAHFMDTAQFYGRLR